MEPKYKSFMDARNAIISKTNTITLTGLDWNKFLRRANAIAMRYYWYIYHVTGKRIRFYDE